MNQGIRTTRCLSGLLFERGYGSDKVLVSIRDASDSKSWLQLWKFSQAGAVCCLESARTPFQSQQAESHLRQAFISPFFEALAWMSGPKPAMSRPTYVKD